MFEHLVFFQSVLEAGAVLSGFCATFLAFRIQREADFHHLPGEPEPKDSQHFTPSFMLVIAATVTATLSGVVIPVLYLGGVNHWALHPSISTAGLLTTLVLLAGYFLSELVHHRIIRVLRGAGWVTESPVWALTVILAACTFYFSMTRLAGM